MKFKLNNIWRERIISLFLCVFFIAIGYFGMSMEIQEDAWYIQSSVDGLFGRDNIDLFVLCSHYVFSFILYLLSLIPIRLFWFNIILFFGVFISNYIVVRIIIHRNGCLLGAILSFVYLSVLTPVLLFTYLNMTTIATYIVACGCLLMAYSIEVKKRKLTFLGCAWYCLGAMIRIDCFAFGFLFFGLFLMARVLPVFVSAKFNIKKVLVSKKREVRVGVFFIFISMILYFSYGIGLNMEHSEFLEWNTARANVENYELPDYDTYYEKYQEIGITKADWQLIKSWNGTDYEYFTTEKYEQIYELMQEVKSESIHQQGLGTYISQVFSAYKNSLLYGVCLACFVFSLFVLKKDGKIFAFMILLISHVLALYFAISGRFIDRIQNSILITTILFMLLMYSPQKTKKNKRYVYSVVLGGFAFLLLFKSVFVNVPAQIEIYKNAYLSKDSVYSHFAFGENTYATYNNAVTDRISEDKENLYFVAVSQSWLTNYPLNVDNIFETSPIGSCDNLAFLSCYMVGLSPSQNNCIRYEIENPFRQLDDENLRIVARNWEAEDLANKLKAYSEEHYKENINYCITESIEDCVVVKYLSNFDNIKRLNSTINYKIEPILGYSNINGMIEISFEMDEKQKENIKEIYLELSSENQKNTYMACVDENKIIIPKSEIDLSKEYSVSLVVKSNGEFSRTNSKIVTFENGIPQSVDGNKVYSIKHIEGSKLIGGYVENIDSSSLQECEYQLRFLTDKNYVYPGIAQCEFEVVNCNMENVNQIFLQFNDSNNREFVLQTFYDQKNIVMFPEELVEKDGTYAIIAIIEFKDGSVQKTKPFITMFCK